MSIYQTLCWRLIVLLTPEIECSWRSGKVGKVKSSGVLVHVLKNNTARPRSETVKKYDWHQPGSE